MSGLLSLKLQEHSDSSKTTNEQFNKALEKLELENQSEHLEIRQIIQSMKRENEEKEEQTLRRFKEVDKKIEDTRKSTDKRLDEFEVKVDRAMEIRKTRALNADTATTRPRRLEELKVVETKQSTEQRIKEFKGKVVDTEQRFNDVYKTLSDAEKTTDKRFSDVDTKIAEEKKNTDKRFSDVDTKIAEEKKNADKRFEDIIKMIKGAEKDTYKRLTFQGQSIVDAVNETNHRFSTFENNMEMIGNSLIDSNKRIEDLTKTVLLTICQCQNKHDSVVNIIQTLARSPMCIAVKRDKEVFPDTVEKWLENFDFSNCDVNLDEQAIMKISKCINPHRILQVGLVLRLSHCDIDQIQRDHNITSRQAYEVILKWRNKMGQKANLKSLVGKLFEAGQEDASNVNVNALTNALVTIKESADE